MPEPRSMTVRSTGPSRSKRAVSRAEIVGGIVISMYLPMFDLISKLTG